MNKITRENRDFQTKMVRLSRAFAVAGFLLCAGGGFAQNVSVQSSGEAQLGQPDSIVAVTANAYGLSQVAPSDLPMYGTYWLIDQNGIMAPLPCPPIDLTQPIYTVTANIFLVDATGGQVAPNRRLSARSMLTSSVESVQAAVEAQGNAIANLIEQIQSAQIMQVTAQMFGMDISTSGGGNSGVYGADYSSYIVGYSFDTNQLWLEITNVPNGSFSYNLHNATNFVYAIETTTDLNQLFTVETEIFPADTNCQPFTLQNNDRQYLFVRAMDWTGVDSDGDGVPDWWAWEYWGTANLMDNNLDYSGNGNTFSQDYSNNVTPTVFAFTGIAVTNNYVNTSQPVVQLNVAGNPYYIAVSVDDTNFQTDAVWQPYSGSNMVVNLGMTEGWKTIYIGLRGHGDDPINAVWQGKRFKLDYTPPALFITNPVNTTVDIPMIQLQGFSPEALSSISYDLTNAAGLLTSQQILVLNQYYDTNTFEFTTNIFQAYDVVLTNGVNTFIFHATDLAGNTTTASYSVSLDYSAKTNPPSVKVTWPQNGTQVSGISFTVDGQVSDATITVSATITDTNGDINTVNGLVERTGKFWLENLPLNSGTNTVTLTATDAAGNMTTNIFNVIQSALTLTMNPVTPDSQLWQPTVNLTGSISDATYAVWVNGVKGHNNGGGAWSASNVPVDSGGTATFTATAYAPNEQQPDGSYGTP